MLVIKILFWLFLAIVFYSYLGYGMLIGLLVKCKKRKPVLSDPQFEPEVTLIIAAYNEAALIADKITNCLSLDYPKHKLQLYFVADGSTDETVPIIQQYPEITLFYQPERAGKIMAINRVMEEVKTDFCIFSDANTFLNKEAIREIVKHYQDEKVGAVSGEKKVIDPSEDSSTAGAGEGMYWKYESFLKRMDSEFNTVVGAAGELFSIRTHLFEPTHKAVLLDDFIISMKICMKGYRVAYEPLAFATEAPSYSLQEEEKRKIRISAGGFQSIAMLKPLLNIFRYGKLSFQYISHRVLRWAVCPFLLPFILILNLVCVGLNEHWIYTLALVLQIVFYSMTAIGWLQSKQNKKSTLFYIPYYFVFMNLALYKGLNRFLQNKQSVLWEKAKRKN